MAVQPNTFLDEYLDSIQESGEGSFSYNPRIEEYEDIANLGIIGQLFNKARRGYGQVDKNVFGGLLPGGSDSRLISTPQNSLRPDVIVRSAPFQAVRDVILEKTNLPKPEQFFIKAMTGGSKDITTMTPEELSLVKGAYNQKYNQPPLTEEEIYGMAAAAKDHHKFFIEQAKKEYGSASSTVKNSPKGQYMLQAINTPFDINQTANAIKAGLKAQKEYVKDSGPVVNLYGQGRDMKMAYGSLSVFPQPNNGVQIYDRWKVDKAKDFNSELKDKADRVLDLGEGGPIPSLIYNVAKRLNTYEPFDIRVNVPAKQWKNIEGRKNKETKEYFSEIEQGDFLNRLNNLYFIVKNKIAPEKSIPVIDSVFPLNDLVNPVTKNTK